MAAIRSTARGLAQLPYPVPSGKPMASVNASGSRRSGRVSGESARMRDVRPHNTISENPKQTRPVIDVLPPRAAAVSASSARDILPVTVNLDPLQTRDGDHSTKARVALTTNGLHEDIRVW